MCVCVCIYIYIYIYIYVCVCVCVYNIMYIYIYIYIYIGPLYKQAVLSAIFISKLIEPNKSGFPFGHRSVGIIDLPLQICRLIKYIVKSIMTR